ncbi:hypothetical protein Mnod_0155 [Methylobacterium nodulans ORS 2060]|uniref:Uncharacterized protein n=1 Tax=Methylobacterium nodulans (strain LMG 21967 / CNCM I-2342 / ORS 2060) TaxID=460265 RepID=B8IUF6_METNO|nr:hypothetical protein Mnod_0155 [Methylobacterium nodulans ORS 2060]
MDKAGPVRHLAATMPHAPPILTLERDEAALAPFRSAGEAGR